MYSLQTAHVTKNASHSSTASSDFDAMSTTTSITKPEKMSGRDFANYFYAYGFLGEQKKMLECHRRMHAYYDSVFKNKDQFKDAVVLDVGTGSGILAIWAAQAGARKVYAVEATYMANHARAMVAANGVGDKVEVIQGLMENLELPEKVDIIISEWMGLFLLRESMLDSVLVARDKFMKPGGSMYPSHARMWVGAVANHTASRNGQMDYQNSLTNFSNFVANTKNQYGVDFSCLMGEYDKEQSSAYMQTSEWCDISPDQILGAPAMLKEFDLNTCTLKDIKVLNESFSLKIERPRGEPSASGEVHVAGFCGWFDVHFRGSKETPATTDVELTTAPDPNGATHWGQRCFWLYPGAVVSPGDSLNGEMHMQRNKENHRLMNVVFKFSNNRMVDGWWTPARTAPFHIK